MPAPTTIDEFLELVRKSGVVDDKRLTTYVDKLRASKMLPSEPGRLAGALVQDGLLTRFQAEQFLQGKWRRFTIGKYKVLEKLGAGGMGNVFLCEHKLMRRRVAVKVLPTKGKEDSSSLERFYREARAVAALDHPNIVRAYDIDQDEDLHFLVMEHVDGSSLQEIVKKNGPMDVLRAAHYIRQAALGLQHAHETAGIVHRDIKPGNILVDRNGIVKILDMGLARFFHDEEDVLTKKYDENVLGTADYLAPEQALDSHSVDIRADIYSLGATFYFCLTGRTPFAEGSVAQKLIWHQTRQPKPIRQLRPEVPEGIVAVLEKMMAKDPTQRYQSPAEAAEALVSWTQTPIPPPPDNEMPQLSPAITGGPTSESGLPSGPRTPAGGISQSRKLWHVKQTNTPTPLSASPAPSPPPAQPPASDKRKTDPPPAGSLNLRLPSAAAAIPGTVAPQQGSAGGNGVAQAVAAPALPARTQPQADEWKELLAEDTVPPRANATTTRAALRNPMAQTRPAGGLPPPTQGRPLAWIIGIASALVLGLIVVAAVLLLIFGGKSDSPSGTAETPNVYYVTSRGGGINTSPTLGEILRRLRGKTRQNVRIVVQEDLAENELLVDVSNVTIEAEAGKAIHWRPGSPSGGQVTKLFAIHKSENVRVRGFTLDGENRVDFLINLFHLCPGVKLEDLTLQGFKNYGIWVTNCEGGESRDRRVQFNRLHFITTQPEQAAFFFSIEPGIRDLIAKNRFIVFNGCKFIGPGTPVKTRDKASLENIEWPKGVEPKQ